MIKEIDNMIETERHMTILESLEGSLREMKLMREGNVQQKTWREYRAEHKSNEIKNKSQIE